MKYLIILLLFPFVYSCTNEGNAAPETITKTAPPSPEPRIEKKLSSLSGSQLIKFSIDYLMGKFDPAKHPDFVSVDKKYSDGDPYFLRKETYEGFKKMWAAAQADNIDLKIISATRNFYRQKSIWEAKWIGIRKIENGSNAQKKYPNPKTRALKILEYSSMPGTSRHHWGTDIDINRLVNSYFETGQGKKEYDWLVANAARFGFCQPYSPKAAVPNFLREGERPHGYNEEKWHWSYMPVAEQLTDLAESELKDKMIGGFKGSDVAEEIGVVEKYVLGINSACRD